MIDIKTFIKENKEFFTKNGYGEFSDKNAEVCKILNKQSGENEKKIIEKFNKNITDYRKYKEKKENYRYHHFVTFLMNVNNENLSFLNIALRMRKNHKVAIPLKPYQEYYLKKHNKDKLNILDKLFFFLNKTDLKYYLDNILKKDMIYEYFDYGKIEFISFYTHSVNGEEFIILDKNPEKSEISYYERILEEDNINVNEIEKNKPLTNDDMFKKL